MYGERHEIPYDSKVKEAIIARLSWGQLAYIAPGVILSYKLSTVVPKIPVDSIVTSRIHWFMPLIIAFLFAFMKDSKTNLPLMEYIITKVKLKLRKRTFYYRRKNMPSCEEVEQRWEL